MPPRLNPLKPLRLLKRPMSLEDDIQALLAQAEPLRCLDDDDPDKEALGPLVDRINALRAKQALLAVHPAGEIVMLLPSTDPMVRKKPGRPPKAKQEGADA